MKSKKQFTLIELIVVIAIVIVLAAAAIMILSSYIVKARDTRRSADLRVMKTGLETALITNAKLPIPDGPVSLTGGGSLLGYQGNFGSSVSKTVNMTKEPKDPADDNYYTYRVDADLKNYQIMAMNESSLSDSDYNQNRINAINYSSRFPNLEGKAMGIILKSNNEPIQLSMTSLNLYSTNQKLKIYISSAGTGSYFEGTGIALQGITQFTANGYDAPAGCPENFIPVPGNQEFNQAGFCVAKYEMTYTAADSPGTPSSPGTIVNSYLYTGNKNISSRIDYPITNIKQTQAIVACKSIGAGYHLITNNEWMTIARNIEQVAINWSSGSVSKGYIYNGNSNDLVHGCKDNSGGRSRATKTGGSDNPALGSIRTTCNDKRQLKLSNGQIIWDLAGNVFEHVNKANTIDGNNNSSNTIWIGNICTSGPGLLSFAGGDGSSVCIFINGYLYSNIGPKTLNLNGNNGIGKIFYNGKNSNIFLRGGYYDEGINNGIYQIDVSRDTTDAAYIAGFRCTK